MTSRDHNNGVRPGDSVRVPPLEERRRRRREGLLIIAASVAVVVFALWEIRRPGATDSAPGNVFSFFVVNLNIILLLLLVFLVLRNVVKLLVDRRRMVPGSRLRTRLVAAFALIAVFPAAVMLLVSLEFSTNAIDDWFNREVEESLLGAWRLAQTYYRETCEGVESDARWLAEEAARVVGDESLRTMSLTEFEGVARDYLRVHGLHSVELISASGTPLLVVSEFPSEETAMAQDRGDLIALARDGRPAIRVEEFGTREVVRGAAMVPSAGDTAGASVLVSVMVTDSARLWSASALNAFREYRKLKLNRTPFKNVYVLTMGLASLVVVFSATWLGIYLARGITEPLGRLVVATKRLAAGDWEVGLFPEGQDEVGTLVDAFNSMAGQLKNSHVALEDRRRYIETVLGHIDAGVIAVDSDGTVSAMNPAAVFLLGLRGAAMHGESAERMFADSGYPEVADLLDGVIRAELPSGTRRSIERDAEGRTLLATATVLETAESARSGFVLFFEDVSKIAAAQRMEVWREVARRIAHEIKNPLTPIQLSAQRMQRRFAGQLSPADAEVLEDCTRTIVDQVDEMKRLVNEFGQFARSATPDKRPCDLNALVEETLPLFAHARPEISVRFEPDRDAPETNIHRESVQRILINLLDNAVAAVSGEMGGPGLSDGQAEIVVRVRHDAPLAKVCLEVADSGPGVSSDLRTRIFEPYYSTRRDGTGLGLAIVASIAADHQAFVRCYENHPRGSRFIVEFPASSGIGST